MSPTFVFPGELRAGDALPPPHSTFGGCGLPHSQLTEKLKVSAKSFKKSFTLESFLSRS